MVVCRMVTWRVAGGIDSELAVAWTISSRSPWCVDDDLVVELLRVRVVCGWFDGGGVNEFHARGMVRCLGWWYHGTRCGCSVSASARPCREARVNGGAVDGAWVRLMNAWRAPWLLWCVGGDVGGESTGGIRHGRELMGAWLAW